MIIRHCRITGLTVLGILLLLCAAHSAERRIALVFGNSAYSGSLRLPNPVNDAQLMAQTLRELGFEVLAHMDAEEKTMKRAIQVFGQRIEQAGRDTVSLFYYAGHAVELSGVNYLVPIRANVERDRDLELEAVRADWVIREMEGAGSRVNILILDACRNNPFKHERSVLRQGGLASMNAPAGSLIAYSTAPGMVAVDGIGKTQTHSPYTAALAHTMKEPGLTVEELFRQVRVRVIEATKGQQTPWENTSLTGQFYFRARSGPPSGGADMLPPSDNPPARVQTNAPAVRPLSANDAGSRAQPSSAATSPQLSCGDILIKLSMSGLDSLTAAEKSFRQQQCRQ